MGPESDYVTCEQCVFKTSGACRCNVFILCVKDQWCMC